MLAPLDTYSSFCAVLEPHFDAEQELEVGQYLHT